MRIKVDPKELEITLLAPGTDEWGDPNTARHPITEAPVYKFAVTGSVIPLLQYYEGKLNGSPTYKEQMAMLAEVGWKCVLLDCIYNGGFRASPGMGWPRVLGPVILDGQSRVAICAALGIQEIEVECYLQQWYKQWSQAHKIIDADGVERWLDITAPPNWDTRPWLRHTWGGAKALPIIEEHVDFQDRSVLDLGCAEGFFCRLAVDRGAVEVLGVDRSRYIKMPSNPGLPEQDVPQQARHMDWIMGHKDSPITYEGHDLAYWTPDREYDIVLAMRIYYHFLNAGGLFLTRATRAAREMLVIQCNTVHTGPLGRYARPEWCMDILEGLWEEVELVDCEEVPMIICRKRKPFPLISIVMANYNMVEFLPEAVETIIHQTIEDWELIVVDDGSTDGSREYLGSLTDPRVRAVYREHEGLVAALNAGLNRCRGSYIARQDSDDTSLPHRLATQLTFLEEHPELDGCGSWFQEMSEEGNAGRVIDLFSDDWRKCWQSLPNFTVVPHPCYFFHRHVYDRYQYLPRFEQAEDYEFLYHAMDTFRLANVQEALVMHRRHKDQRGDAEVEEVHRWTKIVRDQYRGKRRMPEDKNSDS